MLTNSSSLTSGGACLLKPTRASARRAERMVAWIDAYEGSWDTSTVRVSNVYIPFGAQPGHAVIEIRKTAGSRKANRVAFRDPWEAIRVGQRVSIARLNGSGALKHFWVGSVVAPACDIGKDSMTVTCLDDRWLLQDIRIVGRHMVVPTTGAIQWQQGWPAEFNPGGRPNMLLSKTKSGNVAVPGFAPFPDYGLAPDEEPPSSPTEASDENDPGSAPKGESKACYWTLSWIFRYLHYACGPYSIKNDKGGATTDSRYTGHKAPKTCPSSVQWTPGIAAWLDAEETAWFDSGRGQGKAQASGSNRKGRSISADGYALLDFMEMLLATAGGYTLGWIMSASPGTGGGNSTKSILNITRSVARGGNTGATIYVVRGGDISNLEVKSKYWTGGNYTEDGKDLVTRSMGLGSIVKIERQCDTYVNVALKKRWSDDEFTAFRDRGDELNVASVEGMRSLFSEFPNVLAAWKLDTAFDFQKDTSEEDYPRAAVPRPIMPYLLSWIGDEAYDFVAQRYPIRWEISTDDGSSWTAITEMTGLEVLDDGTIYIPALRELTLATGTGSWQWTGDAYAWGAGAIKVNEIRATLAIPCDHRMAAVCKLINSQLSEFDDTFRSPDLNRISASLDRQDILDLRGLYELWLRYESWPVPESQKSAQAEDKPTRENALRNDTDLLRSHTRRHMIFGGRLKRSGYFSKRGIFDTSILQLGNEYSFVSSIIDGDSTVVTPIAAVRSAVEYLCGPGYTETRMHVG
jgi:hypothetical protein